MIGPSPSLTIHPSEASAWPPLDGPHEVIGYTPHKVTIDVDGIECTYPREVLTVQIGGAAADIADHWPPGKVLQLISHLATITTKEANHA